MKNILCLFVIIFALLINKNATATFCNSSGSLISIKKTKSGNYDYLIFTVKLPYNSIPVVSNATPPFIQDASGNTISIQGCKYKKIEFKNVEWTCTTHLYLNNPTTFIKQVKNTGQFEGVISYVAGYSCSAKHVVFYSYPSGAYQKFVLRFAK